MNMALGRIQLSITVQERPARPRDHAPAKPAHNPDEAAYRVDSPAKAAYRVDDAANACRADYERPGGEVEIMSCPDGSWRPLFKAPNTHRRG